MIGILGVLKELTWLLQLESIGWFCRIHDDVLSCSAKASLKAAQNDGWFVIKDFFDSFIRASAG